MAKVSKVVFGNDVVLDLTSDSVTKDNLLVGYTAHGADGEQINGACTFDADTKNVTATPQTVLDGMTFVKAGQEITGTMENRGGEGGFISDKSEEYVIRSGYHDGSGKVAIDDTEKAKLIANNIKSGVTILGVEGSYSGEGGTGQSKTVTPTVNGFDVLPDSGYDYLTQVKVSPIPVEMVENPQGGYTMTIA